MAYGYSPLLPLQKSPEDGFYALTKTVAENTKQNFKNLLLTSPGERVMIPNFGVGLRQLLFANEGTAIESKIAARIEEQVEKYMSFIVINGINFFKHDPPYESSELGHRLGIQIYYSIPQFNFSDLLTINKLPVI